MIYFDNAATSRPKPETVYDAYNYYMREIGTSPGRGSYGLAIQASRMLFQARKTLATFFGAKDPSNVVFTKNSTEAINLFLNGYLAKGDHVLISPFEHNAVLRPLHHLKADGVISYTVLPEAILYADAPSLDQYVARNTKVLVLTLASNLTGQIVFNRRLVEEAHRHNLFVFVDASQGGGKGLVNISDDGIDALAFTGHKDLYGMPGVGGLITAAPLKIAPLIQGGTGIHGESYVNPDAYPDSYEAGTLNMPAIWALKCGVEYIKDHETEIREKERALLEQLLNGLKRLEKIVLYKAACHRVPTVCFNVKGVASSDVVKYLDQHGICVRGGIHCAILAHETIGTVEIGAVRVSVNFFNTAAEIDEFLQVIGAL